MAKGATLSPEALPHKWIFCKTTSPPLFDADHCRFRELTAA
jgi:hypothetical protein